MNKILESYLQHFVRVNMYDFEIYEDHTSHLEKLEKVFVHLDET